LGPGSSCSLFEQCWYLRGFEQFLIDLMINKEFAHALLRKVLDVRLQMYGRSLEQAVALLGKACRLPPAAAFARGKQDATRNT
jgi:hypothetical protein